MEEGLEGITDVSDHDLLLVGLWEQVEANRLDARRLARWEEFRVRRARDVEARRAEDPHFTLTPLQETTIEVGELWAVDAARIASQLGVARALTAFFPEVWAMCLRGELDLYRAGIIADAGRHALDHPEEFGEFAERMAAWLKAALDSDDGRPRLVNRTAKQIRNKVNYELSRLRSGDADERFRKAFKDRRASLRDHEDGMGSLTIGNSIDQVRLADYRLTLAARVLRNQGDERTMEQLRADLAIDLILGRRRVDGSTGHLEQAADRDQPGDGGGVQAGVSEVLPLPRYARPIINVTVPIQTLMGVGDEPGVLSGGGVVPAALVRQIAHQPGSTWYRMLTDRAGRCIELSTTSYRPTEPIWRQVVATFNACYRASCTRPATECELDHRVPWPQGDTSTENLQPGCRRDHKAKHSPGFSVERAQDGSLVMTTAAGFRHRSLPTAQPASDEWPREDLFDVQFSPTELVEALSYIRFLRAMDAPPRDDLWAESALLGRTA